MDEIVEEGMLEIYNEEFVSSRDSIIEILADRISLEIVTVHIDT